MQTPSLEGLRPYVGETSMQQAREQIADDSVFLLAGWVEGTHFVATREPSGLTGLSLSKYPGGPTPSEIRAIFRLIGLHDVREPIYKAMSGVTLYWCLQRAGGGAGPVPC